MLQFMGLQRVRHDWVTKQQKRWSKSERDKYHIISLIYEKPYHIWQSSFGFELHVTSFISHHSPLSSAPSNTVCTALPCMVHVPSHRSESALAHPSNLGSIGDFLRKVFHGFFDKDNPSFLGSHGTLVNCWSCNMEDVITFILFKYLSYLVNVGLPNNVFPSYVSLVLGMLNTVFVRKWINWLLKSEGRRGRYIVFP